MHLSAKEMAKLGLAVPASSAKREPYHTRCVKCAEEFRTQAAEHRHLLETEHRRYELVI